MRFFRTVSVLILIFCAPAYVSVAQKTQTQVRQDQMNAPGPPEKIVSVVAVIYGEGHILLPVEEKFDEAFLTGFEKRYGGKSPKRAPEIWRVFLGSKTVGFVVRDNVRGKSKNITYLVAFDEKGIIVGLEILKYRESHGYQVRYESFRKQFHGKGSDNPISVGVDIRNISGATISARSVTNGARSLSRVISFMLEEGRLQ